MNVPCRRTLLLLLSHVLLAVVVAADKAPASFHLAEGDRVVFLGDDFFEGEREHGWIELMLTARFPDRGVTFRNLAWSGDTPAGAARPTMSNPRAAPADSPDGWLQVQRQLESIRPTVVFMGYGMATSFAGKNGVSAFRSQYCRSLARIVDALPGVRIVLVGPPRHEALGGAWPKPDEHNRVLERYDDVIRETARERGLLHISLFAALRGNAAQAITEDGIHLNHLGYRLAAETIEEHLFGEAGRWRESPHAPSLRASIVRKNEWFFHKWRPNNAVFIYGYLKGRQEPVADETARFEEWVVAEEARIARLRSLQPVDVPPLPLRGGTFSGPAQPPAPPSFEVDPSLEVTLWAENPLFHKAIQMNFDTQGRLWLACSEIYPQREPGQAATDKIIVLEDTMGRGRADKATVFADDLVIPTSVLSGDGGAYIIQGGELLHLKDTDGDGRADSRRTVLRGFGMEDGHHVLHGLKWGMDGMLYFAQGVYISSNIETPHGVVRHKGAGVYRYNVKTGNLEVWYRGWVNPWGHQFDRFGQSFVTDGAGFRGISWAIPGAIYDTQGLSPARRILESVSPGLYPKFIGMELIHSDHFPESWQGDAVTCDFRAHTVKRLKFSERGSAYVTKEMPDIIRAVQQDFRPIDIKLGPDGALYLADWSNPIIQHSGVDFREPRRDRSRGRIWRITAKRQPLRSKVDFTIRSNRELFHALLSPNSYEVESARRVLLERAPDIVLPELATWVSREGEPARLQALWIRQAFDAPQAEIFEQLLASSDHRVRAAAVRALPAGWPVHSLAALVKDEHPRVRLEAVRALARLPSAEAMETALRALDFPMDPFLDYALWLTVNDLAPTWVHAMKTGVVPALTDDKAGFVLKAIPRQLAAEVFDKLMPREPLPRDGSGPWIDVIAASGGPQELGRLFGQTTDAGFDDEAAARALSALAEASRLRGLKPEGRLDDLIELAGGGKGVVRTAAIQLIGEWKLQSAGELLTKVARSGAGELERKAAIAALRSMGGAAAESILAKLSGEGSSPALRADAVIALAALNWEGAVRHIAALLNATAEPADAEYAWRGLLRVSKAGEKLATVLRPVDMSPQVARVGVRIAREANQYPSLVNLLATKAGLKVGSGKLSAGEIKALANDAVGKGDAVRGEQVYRRPELACVSCHAIGGVGGKIGPDLSSIGASAPPDYLLESMLDPNASIKHGYDSVVVTTRDQKTTAGLLVRETPDNIVLRDAAGQEVSIATSSIEERRSIGSLMPAGLIDTLLPDERDDLVKFLSVLGTPGEFSVNTRAARAWKVYVITTRLQFVPLEQIVRGDFTLADWAPAYSLVNGGLPRATVEQLISERTNRGLYIATRFFLPKSQPVTFQINSEVKGTWVNGVAAKMSDPRSSGGEIVLSADARAGENTIVIQLHEMDSARISPVLKLVSDDVSFLAD